jgi:hypothetical protein
MATTPGKLPKDVVPHVYVVRLEQDTDNLVTAGSESIEFEVLKATDRIVINSVELATESRTSEERRMYLHALSAVLDPNLAQRSVEFFMSKNVAPGDGGRALEELAGEHPEIVWIYATTHLKEMQRRFGFFRWNRLLPSLAAGFTDSEHADELIRFAKENLPAQGQREADNAANLIRFRAQLKTRELPSIDRWIFAKGLQISANTQSDE